MAVVPSSWSRTPLTRRIRIARVQTETLLAATWFSTRFVRWYNVPQSRLTCTVMVWTKVRFSESDHPGG